MLYCQQIVTVPSCTKWFAAWRGKISGSYLASPNSKYFNYYILYTSILISRFDMKCMGQKTFEIGTGKILQSTTHEGGK
jgi:hypothetical protein